MTAGGTMPGGAGDATHARRSARRLCDAVPRGRVEATLGSRGGRLELLNPRYRFQPGGDV